MTYYYLIVKLLMDAFGVCPITLLTLKYEIA